MVREWGVVRRYSREEWSRDWILSSGSDEKSRISELKSSGNVNSRSAWGEHSKREVGREYVHDGDSNEKGKGRRRHKHSVPNARYLLDREDVCEVSVTYDGKKEKVIAASTSKHSKKPGNREEIGIEVFSSQVHGEHRVDEGK